jgi:flagellar hook assembly protein FlgD
MQILSTAIDHLRSNLTAKAASSAANGTTTGTTSGATSGTSSSAAGLPDQLTKESTFLGLLVAQIKNQDPLNPTDSIQFVGQLVQFSQLEQLLSINQGVTALAKGNQPATPSATPQPTRNGS